MTTATPATTGAGVTGSRGAEAPRPPGGRRTSRAVRARRSAARSLPLLPAAVLLLVFLAGPIITAFLGSFTDDALSGSASLDTSFVGFDNYTALFASPTFPSAVVLTFVFVLLSAVVGQNIVGLALALLMRVASRPVKALVGTVVVGAWVLPEVVAAFASYAFYQDNGTLNALLRLVGITGPEWLYTYPVAVVIIANVWRGAAFSMLVYSAALSDVPPEITESAEMDGASGAKRLVFVTLPMIRSTIATNSMIITLQTLSVFTLIYVMTAGGPSNASTTLPLLAYQEAFKIGQIGYGTAIAAIMLLVGGVFSIFYIRALSREAD